MKKVTRFEAEDGTLFETALECEAHESLCELKSWYEENSLGRDVDWDDLVFRIKVTISRFLSYFKL